MNNKEKLFIKFVIDTCREEYARSKRIPQSINWIYEEAVSCADSQGLTIEEWIKNLKIN